MDKYEARQGLMKAFKGLSEVAKNGAEYIRENASSKHKELTEKIDTEKAHEKDIRACAGTIIVEALLKAVKDSYSDDRKLYKKITSFIVNNTLELKEIFGKTFFVDCIWTLQKRRVVYLLGGSHSDFSTEEFKEKGTPLIQFIDENHKNLRIPESISAYSEAEKNCIVYIEQGYKEVGSYKLPYDNYYFVCHDTTYYLDNQEVDKYCERISSYLESNDDDWFEKQLGWARNDG